MDQVMRNRLQKIGVAAGQIAIWLGFARIWIVPYQVPQLRHQRLGPLPMSWVQWIKSDAIESKTLCIRRA
jgi:hypothetical protein